MYFSEYYVNQLLFKSISLFVSDCTLIEKYI